MPQVTPMVQRIMIACVAFWLMQAFVFPELTGIGAVSVGKVFEGYLWQPFTYMWLHEPRSIMHLGFNMFALWMFGGTLEQMWGSKKFLRFYLICGVGAGVIILIWNALIGNIHIPTLGASGAIYGLLTAFSLTFPDRRIMLLFPPIPIKAIWFIPVLFFLQFAMSGGADNVSHIGHLGGVIVAAILMRNEARRFFSLPSLRYRWHRYRMKGKLRAVRKDEWERQKRDRERFH